MPGGKLLLRFSCLSWAPSFLSFLWEPKEAWEFRGKDAPGFVVGKTSNFIYLLLFILPLPKLAAASSRLAVDISKWERDKAVDVPADFSAAGERPCSSLAAHEASSVTELGPLHAQSFS